MQAPNTYFITSSLPYVNNVPHLGNIIGSTLSGDIYARFKKSQGHNVIYLCGTDEYGTATMIKAKASNLSPKQICDKYHAEHKQIYDWFNIQFDVWGRTTTQAQTDITHEIFNELYTKGLIEEKIVEQYWCNQCEMFLADRYIKGGCYHPNCVAISKGDQCDSCQKMIDATSLINPTCVVCDHTPVLKLTNHLFLKLQELEKTIDGYLDTKTNLKPHIMSIAKAWLAKGLNSRCITRDITWGTSLPQHIIDAKPEYQFKSFYVWFDAPFGYYSILANCRSDWREYLQSPNLKWVSSQAKDNVPFHTIVFPGSILGSGLNLPLINSICGTEYLLYEGKKFSKSEGVGLFGTDVITISNSLGINEDYWRFYLIKIRPEIRDTSFTKVDFVQSINSELINNIGNYINRCISLTIRYCNGTCTIGTDQDCNTYVSQYENLMDDFRFACALKLCLELSSKGNAYIQSTRPWIVAKTDINSVGLIISRSFAILLTLLKLLTPFIPRTIASITDKINIVDNTVTINGPVDLPFKKITLADFDKAYLQ